MEFRKGLTEHFRKNSSIENDEILLDLEGFADKLTGYLQWYNGKRPHMAPQLPVATSIYTNSFSGKYVPITLAWKVGRTIYYNLSE